MFDELANTLFTQAEATVSEVEKARLYELSLACRAAQADKKGWQSWVEALNPARKASQKR